MVGAKKIRNIEKFPQSIQNLLSYIVGSGVVTKITLFGSRARGNARDNSDYDFSVHVNNRVRWTELLAEISEKNLTLLPVDFLVYDEATVDYKKSIDAEGVAIYG